MKELLPAKFIRRDIIEAHAIYSDLYNMNARTLRDKARKGRRPANSLSSRFAYGSPRKDYVDRIFTDADFTQTSENVLNIFLNLVGTYETLGNYKEAREWVRAILKRRKPKRQKAAGVAK